MKKQILSLAAGAALLTAASSSFAAPGNVVAGNLQYNVTVTGSCTAASVAGTPVDLGDFDSITQSGDHAVANAGSIAVTCSKEMPYAIMIDGGNYPAGGKRNMSDAPTYGGTGTGSNVIAYDLQYPAGTSVGDNNPLDPAYLPVFNSAGWAAGITDASVDGITPISYDLTAVVTIPLGAAPGTYGDQVGVTVTW